MLYAIPERSVYVANQTLGNNKHNEASPKSMKGFHECWGMQIVEMAWLNYHMVK